jgi:hypothetical protein
MAPMSGSTVGHPFSIAAATVNRALPKGCSSTSPTSVSSRCTGCWAARFAWVGCARCSTGMPGAIPVLGAELPDDACREQRRVGSPRVYIELISLRETFLDGAQKSDHKGAPLLFEEIRSNGKENAHMVVSVEFEQVA